MTNAVNNNITPTFNGEQLTQADRQSLKAIWDRKKGELFTTNGVTLQKMGKLEKFLYTVSSSYRSYLNARLRPIIATITGKIRINDTDHADYKGLITTLFLEKLAPLSRGIYRRELTVDQYRHLWQAAQINIDDLSPQATAPYEGAYKAAQFWAKMGNFKTQKGASLSYQLIAGKVGDLEEKSIGLFKPTDGEPLSPSNPSLWQRTKRNLYNTLLYPFSGSLPQLNGGQGYIAEAAATIVDRYVREGVRIYLQEEGDNLTPQERALLENLTLVPETHVVSCRLPRAGTKKGSLQTWEQGRHQEACEFLETNRFYRRAWRQTSLELESLKQKLPPVLFDLLVVVDYFTGNCDRHGENWFCMLDENRNMNGIRLIDGGKAFSPVIPNSTDFLEWATYNNWKTLPLAQEGFSPLAQSVIAHLYERRRDIRGELEALYDTHAPKCPHTQGRLAGAMRRLATMDTLRATCTKRGLANIVTQRNFRSATV